MKNYFNNQSVLYLILKWKIHLIIITLVALVASSFFSSESFITPKFKSKAIVYPVNLWTYSEESETEQMLQIFQSTEIKDKIFNTFQLGKHYELDKNDPYFYSYLNNEFRSNISFRKTEYESVEIEVFDRDPKFASNITDSIISFYNAKALSLHAKKSQEMVDISGRDMKKKKKDIFKLIDSINKIRRKYNLLDFNIEAKQVAKSYVTSSYTTQETKNLRKNLANQGELLKSISERLTAERIILDSISKEYDVYFSNANKIIDYSQVISSPFPSDKKSYPVRWLIVLISTLTTLFLSIVIIGIIENKNK